MPKMASISRAYLIFNGIRAFDPDSPDAVVDITTLPIQVAFVAKNAKPLDTDWHPGEWVNSTKARIKVGPGVGSIALADGYYDVWLNVVGAHESPAWMVGQLAVGTP